MKKTIVAGFIATLALAGLAEPVSREQAETAARAWVRDGYAVGESLSPEVGDVREVRFSDDGLPLYVADFAGGGNRPAVRGQVGRGAGRGAAAHCGRRFCD